MTQTQNRRWISRVRQRWSWANSISESIPSAHLLRDTQGPQGSTSDSSQKQHPLQHISHTQEGFCFLSCLQLLWSPPAFTAASAGGDTGTVWKSHLPNVHPPSSSPRKLCCRYSNVTVSFSWKSATLDCVKLQPYIYLWYQKYNPLPCQSKRYLYWL